MGCNQTWDAMQLGRGRQLKGNERFGATRCFNSLSILVRPVAQLVEHRTPNLLPVRAQVRDASALDIYM